MVSIYIVAKRKKRDYSAKINAIIKNLAWRNVKFIGGETARKAVVEQIFLLLDLEGKEDKTDWCDAHSRKIISTVNNLRSTVAGDIKKRLHTYFIKNDEIPSLERFEACLDRTLDPDNEEDLDLFAFWVGDILQAACGNKHDWCKDVRLVYTISEALDKHAGNGALGKYMGPSTEAMAMVAIKNYYKVWIAHFEWQKKHPGEDLPQPTSEKNPAPKDPENVFPVSLWVPLFQGQVAYCGWKKEGQTQFGLYKVKNEVARKGDNSKALEAKVLVKLQKIEEKYAPASKKKAKKSEVSEEVNTLDEW